MADETAALQIFETIDKNPESSQKKISDQTGIAVGLVHSFMSRVIARGWIRAKQVNAKRWLYFLTPEGFIEKGRLSMSYLLRTLKSYSMMQNFLYEQIKSFNESGWRRFVVLGENELAEITVLNIKATPSFELVGIIVPNPKANTVKQEKILKPEALDGTEYDIVLVCDFNFDINSFASTHQIGKDKFINLSNLLINSPILSKVSQ